MSQNERIQELQSEVSKLREQLSAERDLTDQIETQNLRLMQRLKAAQLILDCHRNVDFGTMLAGVKTALRLLGSYNLDGDLVDQIPF